jgi:hypothetical protein
MARAVVVLYQSVFALRPAKAEPLLFDADVKAYRTSEKPCAPGLRAWSAAGSAGPSRAR